jgi:hypothetical protein
MQRKGSIMLLLAAALLVAARAAGAWGRLLKRCALQYGG